MAMAIPNEKKNIWEAAGVVSEKPSLLFLVSLGSREKKLSKFWISMQNPLGGWDLVTFPYILCVYLIVIGYSCSLSFNLSSTRQGEGFRFRCPISTFFQNFMDTYMHLYFHL